MERVRSGNKKRGLLAPVIPIASVAALVAVILLGSEEISGYFNEGVRLAAERVLPTTFPFMVLSSLAITMIDVDNIPRAARGFERLFSVGRCGFSAFIIGALTGFPIGAKMTAEIYRSGGLERDDAERLIAYSSNASPPFILAVVGAGMLGDIFLGVILLISVHLGTLITAQLFRRKTTFSRNSVENVRQKFDFVDSVRSAAMSSIYMTAFVTLFYIIRKCITDTLKFAPLSMPIALILEVTGALASIADSEPFGLSRMGLSGFALGFGGLSVMAQTAAVIKGSGVSLRQYLPIKLAVGTVSALAAMGLSALYAYL